MPAPATGMIAFIGLKGKQNYGHPNALATGSMINIHIQVYLVKRTAPKEKISLEAVFLLSVSGLIFYYLDAANGILGLYRKNIYSFTVSTQIQTSNAFTIF